MHRLLVTSGVYRQASQSSQADAARRQDPENRWLWRFNRKRLEAESLRDSLLAISGRLNTQLGGPSVLVPVEKELVFKGFEDVKAGIVKWPMSVIRISAEKKERLIELADKILLAWRGYTDEAAFIFAETDGEPHNTITPIARRRGDLYELDLVLRNNITTEEHPLGVYHPHAKLHHIKKENIGLIEVMGLAVLPARLKKEMADLEQALLDGTSIREDEVLAKHADWVEEFLPKYGFTFGSGLEGEVTPEKLHDIVQTEIGLVFKEVLKDAGVYKCTEEGRTAFMRFVDKVNA